MMPLCESKLLVGVSFEPVVTILRFETRETPTGVCWFETFFQHFLKRRTAYGNIVGNDENIGSLWLVTVWANSIIVFGRIHSAQ